MKIITAWNKTEQEIASITLRNRGVILFPADTVFGLITEASKEGIAKLDQIKKRQQDKNYALIFDSLASLEKSVKIAKKDRLIIAKNAPGFFTFVIKPKLILDSRLICLMSEEGKFGIRIPDSKLMTDLCKLSGEPLIATSANRSGQPVIESIQEAQGILPERLIDLVIDIKFGGVGRSSTVVDLAKNPPEIIRPGSGVLKI